MANHRHVTRHRIPLGLRTLPCAGRQESIKIETFHFRIDRGQFDRHNIGIDIVQGKRRREGQGVYEGDAAQALRTRATGSGNQGLCPT